MAKVKVTETVLRDAHQSLIATRMTTDEMRPILGEMDKVGYYSAEVWGGATFDACLRFLDEDPWERLRIIRKEMPNTKLQMLFRGQNMLGLSLIHIFILPERIYFKVMQYERVIMFAIIALLFIGVLDRPLIYLRGLLVNGLDFLTGFVDIIARAIMGV